MFRFIVNLHLGAYISSAETVYGVLPAMTVDGKEFHQGNAMATYLARENGKFT